MLSKNRTNYLKKNSTSVISQNEVKWKNPYLNKKSFIKNNSTSRNYRDYVLIYHRKIFHLVGNIPWITFQFLGKYYFLQERNYIKKIWREFVEIWLKMLLRKICFYFSVMFIYLQVDYCALLTVFNHISLQKLRTGMKLFDRNFD